MREVKACARQGGERAGSGQVVQYQLGSLSISPKVRGLVFYWGGRLAFYSQCNITWFLDYHYGRNRKDGLKREEPRGISYYYYFKFLAAS